MKPQDKGNIKKAIKKIFVKEFLNEGGWDSNNDITLFHGYPSGVQRFPYGDIDIPENLSKLNLEKMKQTDNGIYKNFSKNKDVYNFPMEEFKLGLEVEKKDNKRQKHIESIFDTAGVVIQKIAEDPQFYTKATTYETI